MEDLIARLKSALADRYQIERELGHGGMATVYLAEDLKHHRKVAVKVLKPELAAAIGPERFLREIEIAAQLTHPHILPLHDSGEAEGFLYYVMPYVEGESLRERLSRERHLPVEDAVSITTAVASALDYAHRHEVIHRDIKPENILVHEGQALVADFGIALAVSVAGGERLTETGLSLGTPCYMSPEQATGEQQLDQRADMYSLGAVLYEMLAGEAPHSGPTAQATIARVLADEPERLSTHRRTVPPHVEAAVHKALEKLPADRFHTAAEFAAALAQPGYMPTSDLARPGTPRDDRVASAFGIGRPILTVAAVVVVALAAAFAAFNWGSSRSATPQTVRRWDIVLPDSAPLAFVGSAELGVGRSALAISPDGSHLAYAAARGESSMLYVRPLDRRVALPIPGTEGAYHPFFSPDGQWVGFLVGRELRKVSVSGGPPITLSQLIEPWTAVWLPDGRIVVAEYLGTRLGLVPADGGLPTPLTWRPGRRVVQAQVLPDGQWLLYASAGRTLHLRSVETGAGFVFTSDGLVAGEPSRAVEPLRGSEPRYLESGHIVFAMSGGDGVLMAMPFDAERREVLGPAMPVLDGVRQETDAGSTQYAVSADGDLVYAPGRNAAKSLLVQVGGNGRRDTLPFPRADYGAFDLSPSGRELLVRLWPPASSPELWVLDLERGTRSRIPIRERPGAYSVTWWPDGRRVVLTPMEQSLGQSPATLRLSAANPEVRDTIFTGGTVQALSPDGRVLGVVIRDSLWIVPTSDGAERRFIEEGAGFPAFSPDGRWLAYTSRQTGRSEVFVTRVTDPRERHRLSPDGGEEPVWSASGDEVVYRIRDRWFAVSIATRGDMRVGRARLLFEGPFHNVAGWSHDLGPYGRHMVLLGPPEQTVGHLNVVTNWLEELKRLAPAAK
jgi:serine/threonine-protein kinase